MKLLWRRRERGGHRREVRLVLVEVLEQLPGGCVRVEVDDVHRRRRVEVVKESNLVELP